MSRAAAIAILVCSSVGQAGSIYLNGVNIDGVTSQKFDKATVKIDEQGNVFIEAPGYAVRSVQGPPQDKGQDKGTGSPATDAPAPTRITHRYWLVATQSDPGMAEYDIDVYINAKWLMKIRNGTDQEVVDITKNLQPGKNTVMFEARKVTEGARKSFSQEHTFNVVIGEGNEAGGNVMIDNPLVSFKRTAADNDNVSKDFTLVAR